MEVTTEFKIRLTVWHETNKASYNQERVFDSYEELSDWLRVEMFGPVDETITA